MPPPPHVSIVYEYVYAMFNTLVLLVWFVRKHPITEISWSAIFHKLTLNNYIIQGEAIANGKYSFIRVYCCSSSLTPHIITSPSAMGFLVLLHVGVISWLFSLLSFEEHSCQISSRSVNLLVQARNLDIFQNKPWNFCWNLEILLVKSPGDSFMSSRENCFPWIDFLQRPLW